MHNPNDWFDSHGYLLREIPQDCIEECAHIGNCEEDVKRWQKKLNFIGNRNLGISYLLETGGFQLDELLKKTDVELYEIILWIACSDLKENIPFYGLSI